MEPHRGYRPSALAWFRNLISTGYTALRLYKKVVKPYSVISVSRTPRMVVTISSRKGGCGKTVLAMILAATLAEEGADVALLDADPTPAAPRWATKTRPPPVRAHAEADAERLAELL